jgi:L-cysteine:1D-myo-inositol 2-amino-2-deoxy-alpha-D-glucopyranoside ligase
MRSWPAPALTSLARERLGPAPELHLFDNRSGSLRPTGATGQARMYVCGITPYDATHLGHASTYLAFDLVNRAWRESGREVLYVQNVTDVDDPLLERAVATGQDWRELAERETELFRTDMQALAVIPPDHYIGAVEAIPVIVEAIRTLREAGAVYDVDGDLYFSVKSDPAFGTVSGYDRETMLALFAERGGDPDRPGKRDPLDCLLWQAARPGEPSWASEFGPGRPGWHIECTAIARHHLGADFDVQGGGSDLTFPHHEMSASHAQAGYPGEPFAEIFAYGGMVGYEGHKMSKSRGNLVLVSRLREAGVDPRIIRLAVLSQHYRSDWEWRDALLEPARARLEKWQTAVRRGGADAEQVVAAVRAALARDLDAPAALAAVDDWAASSGSGDKGSGELVAASVQASLGVSLVD